MTVIALLSRAPFPGANAVRWALLGGLSGGLSLAVFYRALASGKMGLTAPVAAVFGSGHSHRVDHPERGCAGKCQAGWIHTRGRWNLAHLAVHRR